MSTNKKELNQMALRGIAAERARLDALEHEIRAELQGMVVPGPTAVPDKKGPGNQLMPVRSARKKRVLSAAGRAAIGAAARKRWAKVRKAQKAA